MTSSTSPKLYSWAITWQLDVNKWQDLFNSTHRISSKSKVTIEGGTITISTLQGEWPMFGFNAQNTRATESEGAKGKTLKWYSREEVGSGFRNPVVAGGYVYIAERD